MCNQSIKRQVGQTEFGGLVIQSEGVPLDLVGNAELLKKHFFKSHHFFLNDLPCKLLVGIQVLLFAPKAITGKDAGLGNPRESSIILGMPESKVPSSMNILH